MKKKIYYKNLVFSKLNVFDISLGYLNWFKKKERTKFIIKKPNSLIQLNNFVKKCNKDKGVLLVGVFDKMKNHKQILMNQTYFSKSHLSFVQELKSAWIVGIYGKADFWNF